MGLLTHPISPMKRECNPSAHDGVGTFKVLRLEAVFDLRPLGH